MSLETEFCFASFAMLFKKDGQLQHVKLYNTENIDSNTVCRKLLYFSLTHDERFYRVLNGFFHVLKTF